MQDKTEQQRPDDAQAPAGLELRGDVVSEPDRRGEWQGYDPTLLTALFDD
jgi:hypothetical protein